MAAVSAAELPDGPDWSYEVKWDGYRAQAVKNGASVSLASRNLKNITRQFPEVVSAAAALHAKTAVLDGEIVALGADGRPSFQALHHASTEGLSIVYYAFDLLHLNGRTLTDRPLDERREALRTVVAGTRVLLSDPLPGTAAQIAAAVRGLGLEGVVAKRRGSLYAPGRRSDAWIKVRFAQRQELVIGGFKPSATSFDSLLVGYYDGRKLMCAGKVRAGFTPHLRAQVFERIKGLQTSGCPFVNLPSARSGHWGEGISADDMKALRWVKPKQVAEISFVEWTRDGSLRHAAFVALRDDKAAADVVRERVAVRASGKPSRA
jgi:DNA ligase D-like protein (predicted ligase)